MPNHVPVTTIPRPGVFATVRNRRGVVTTVEPCDGETGRLHLVHIDYKDDQSPPTERLLWELEPRSRLLESTALPRFDSSHPMPCDDFDAVLRASRWTAISPYLDPDGSGPLERLPISSPFHGAVQIEDFQLVPLLKALRMPRVNLLIADDVGLGKTIEAGLILTELLLRRRIQRVLILTPASLRIQWKDEMWEKFALHFDLIDRSETHSLHKRLGTDANPWRAFSRIIASYHYLRQEDVLMDFMAACRKPDGSPHLPWDLLIVDECHNLMPSAIGDDSDLCRMLRLIAPQFEHRLFLSATPHNGHTRCFTGLLEILDPIRFSQTDDLKPAERERIRHTVIRRLKREINERTHPPRFCTRQKPQAIVLDLSAPEIALSRAFDAFRAAIRNRIGAGDRRRKRAGRFAIEILGKRLLSCPTAFAESWHRCKEGLADDRMTGESDVDIARRTLARDTSDDREMQSREDNAAGIVGSWMKSVADDLRSEIGAIDAALMALRLKTSPQMNGAGLMGCSRIIDQNPEADARFEALLRLIDLYLRSNRAWRDDERLIVFTEYKTTLDYLLRRIRTRYEPERILSLYGGMDEIERDLVKQAFNDPSVPVRILIATDAAAEGLNLQHTARYLLHFDCPWNPSKLEQRNGRVDRHGQARDVTVFHFVTDQVHDLAFLAHVIRKADEIREDLGSANELFDEAAHRRLIEGESVLSVQSDLDKRIMTARGRAAIPADTTAAIGDDGEAAGRQLQALESEIDLDPDALRDTLEAAMAIRVGRPQLDPQPMDHTWRVRNPGLRGWSDVIDDSLRRTVSRQSRGPVMRLAFSSDPFLTEIGGRIIFSPSADVMRVHLSHPMMQRALSSLTRLRFPGTGDEVSRWTVRTGDVPDGADGLVLLHLEEMAVNDLRETFHHWIRTLAIPIANGMLGERLPHRPAKDWRASQPIHDPRQIERAREWLEDSEPELKALLAQHARTLTAELRDQLNTAGIQARRLEAERYRSRMGEISKLIETNTIARLQKEIENLKILRSQGHLYDQDGWIDTIDRSIDDIQAEIHRRNRHYEDVREQLGRERVRILEYLLPRRHLMTGPAQVFPVALEIRYPGDGR